VQLTSHSTSGSKAPSAGGRKDVGLGRSAHLRGHLGHGSQVALDLHDLLDAPSVLGLIETAENLLHGLAAVHPLLQQGLDSNLLRLGGQDRLDRGLAAGGGLRLGTLRLALAALGRLARGRRGRATSTAVVVVNTLHVVPKVPLAGEAVARDSTLATLVHAQEGLVAVSVESMGLTLMSEKASGGGEARSVAGLGLAAVGLQVRVDEFIIVALELLGLVVAVGSALPGAVEETVRLDGDVLVQLVVPGRLALVSLSASGEWGRQRQGVLELGYGLSGSQILRKEGDLAIDTWRLALNFRRRVRAEGGREPCLVNGGRRRSPGDGAGEALPGSRRRVVREAYIRTKLHVGWNHVKRADGREVDKGAIGANAHIDGVAGPVHLRSDGTGIRIQEEARIHSDHRRGRLGSIPESRCVTSCVHVGHV
jgi:hypothetical protein